MKLTAGLKGRFGKGRGAKIDLHVRGAKLINLKQSGITRTKKKVSIRHAGMWVNKDDIKGA